MVISQQELEARYAQAIGAPHARFVYAGHVSEAVERLDLVGDADLLVDTVGGPGLRVADVRACTAEARGRGGRLLVDITVPSHFGLRPFELGADVSLEALDRVAAGKLRRKVVAIAMRGPLAFEGDGIDSADLEAIGEGLTTVPERMQRHFDHARALAEYLNCCEGLPSVSYPGLGSHPDHDLATRVLMHGFGPAVDFELPAGWGVTAGEFIARCRRNGRDRPAGGFHTRLHARDGAEGLAIRIFAGLDNPLEIADDLDQAMRWFRNPPAP